MKMGPRNAKATGSRGDPAAGFTLIEFAIAIGIVALAVTLAGPLVRGPTMRQTIDALAGEIAADLRSTRAAAITANLDRRFVVDVAARQLGPEGRKPRRVPAGVEIDVTGAGSEVVGGTSLRLTFHPDGSTSGARIVLRPAVAGTAGTATIDVDWLSGQVSMRRIGPGSVP